eukprot:1159843-Pelagomonas_calceolata.AAC.3
MKIRPCAGFAQGCKPSEDDPRTVRDSYFGHCTNLGEAMATKQGFDQRSMATKGDPWPQGRPYNFYLLLCKQLSPPNAEIMDAHSCGLQSNEEFLEHGKGTQG